MPHPRWLLAVALFLVACASPAATTPDAGADAATCVGTCGAAGTFHDQTIVVAGETRHYFLHVPGVAIGTAAPLLVDYHGTGFVDQRPEEEWGLDELIAASDALGFIVVRPRSHAYVAGGQTYYQWDLSPADLASTLELTTELVASLGMQYALDPGRIYAAGFSNGTNMALQTLALAPPLFHGIGIVGGGIYEPFTIPAWPAPAPRIYATSGYRDLNYEFQRDMQGWLAANHYPADRLWIRESKALHELRGWHYREMFGWLDRGARPVDGTLAPGWTTEPFTGATTNLVATTRTADGRVIATGHDGSIWQRGASGWTAARAATATPVLIAACMAGATGYATGEAQGFTTADGGATWQPAPAIPLAGNSDFATTQLFGVGCGPNGERVGGGSVVAAHSADGGQTWTTTDPPALIFTVRRGASGAWLAIGPGYLGRSLDGVSFTAVAIDPNLELYDVAEAGPGTWWTVGVDGAMLRSTDDGASWQAQPAAVPESLYAVKFASALVGAAVGPHGTAIVTLDGGATWMARPAGVDRMLADLEWLDATHAIVVGEHGLVLGLAP